MAPHVTRILRGALAGTAAAGVWAAQEPLDRRVFRVPYSDPYFLGTTAFRNGGRRAVAAGWAMHLANGAAFGAVYSAVAPSVPLPRPLRGPLAGLVEHVATWPLTPLAPRLHPAAALHPQLWGSRAALAQATWRHLLFGVVLGEVERRLNPPADVPVAEPAPSAETNGHGDRDRIAVPHT
jgi:hypothetical protein